MIRTKSMLLSYLMPNYPHSWPLRSSCSTSLPFLKWARHSFTSVPLQKQSCLPWMLFPQLSARLTLSSSRSNTPSPCGLLWPTTYLTILIFSTTLLHSCHQQYVLEMGSLCLISINFFASFLFLFVNVCLIILLNFYNHLVLFKNCIYYYLLNSLHIFSLWELFLVYDYPYSLIICFVFWVIHALKYH